VTLADAIAADDIAAWVDAFLRATGNNVELADGLRKAPRWWRGPIRVPLGELVRVVGPEPEMEYYEPEASWQRRIAEMIESLERGWDPPPVIAEYRAGTLSVRDGGHRVAALARAGRDAAWTIIWFNDQSNLNEYWRSNVPG
jgi:hypothetical protein